MKSHAIRVAKPLPFQSLVLAAGLAAALGAVAWPGEAGALGPRARREWTLQATRDPKTYELDLRETSDGSLWGNSRRVPRTAIQGLPDGGLDANQHDVTLRFKRDAGTIVATGSIRNGRGEGSFDIELDPAYAAELERRGVGRPSAEQHRRLLHADASFAFLDALQANGYPVPRIGLFVRCADHGVDQEFVQDLSSAGYRLDSIESLVRTRDHGVDGDFIRELGAAGYKLDSIEELVRVRDHGVDGDFIGELAAAGYHVDSIESLVRVRDHGVDGDFIRDLKAAGLKDLELDELVRARDHGVDADYLREMRAAGYGSLTLSQAIRARDHGVDGRFAKNYQRRHGRPATLDELIHARDIGG